jgi:hypothetical protein
MTGNLIKDLVLMSHGIMVEQADPNEYSMESMQSCLGDCQTCKKCGEGNE